MHTVCTTACTTHTSPPAALRQRLQQLVPSNPPSIHHRWPSWLDATYGIFTYKHKHVLTLDMHALDTHACQIKKNIYICTKGVRVWEHRYLILLWSYHFMGTEGDDCSMPDAYIQNTAAFDETCVPCMSMDSEHTTQLWRRLLIKYHQNSIRTRNGQRGQRYVATSCIYRIALIVIVTFS